MQKRRQRRVMERKTPRMVERLLYPTLHHKLVPLCLLLVLGQLGYMLLLTFSRTHILSQSFLKMGFHYTSVCIMIPVLESGSLWDIKTQSLWGIISLKCQCSLSPFVIRHPLSSYSVTRLSCCASAQCSGEVSVQGFMCLCKWVFELLWNV